MLIKNATVIDGTGRPAYVADVLISDGKIAKIGTVSHTCERNIIATGKILCPGFLDIHAHSELEVLRDPSMKHKTQQGITFDLSGNCGVGVYPRKPDDEPCFADILGHYTDWDWTDFESYRNKLRTDFKTAYLQSHANLRMCAINGNPNREATDSEIEEMCRLLDISLSQGCIGFSSGLYYAPNVFASKKEIIKLLEVVKKHDALFCVHHRCEGDEIVSSVEEVINYMKATGVRLEISHLKAIGKDNQDKIDTVLDMIHAAKQDGYEIGFDQYPYNYGSTSLFSLLPPDLLGLGLDKLNETLEKAIANQELYETIVKKIENPDGWDSIVKLCGFENITASYLEKHSEYSTKTLAAIAEEMNTDPYRALFTVLKGESLALMTDVTQSRETLVKVLKDELMCFGTDALYTGSGEHPRSGNAAVHLIEEHCIKNQDLSLEECIRKMTGEVAKRLRLTDFGTVEEGKCADLVLFDPKRLKDNSSPAKPFKPCDGIELVLIDGKQQ